jgi:hypothetical protein
MAKDHYLPDDEASRVLWLNNFVLKLATYAATLNIPAAEVTEITNAAALYSFTVNRKRQFAQYAADLVAYCKLLANGKATDNIATYPVPPALGAVPPLVLAGLFKRVASIAARAKKHPGYTEAIGKDLGIEGSPIVMHAATAKPVLNVRPQGGHPEILWRLNRMDGLEIWKDPGTGVFALLDVDDAPDYVDLSPLPADVTLWRYKAIYRLGGEQVGQWSDVVEIAVHA